MATDIDVVNRLHKLGYLWHVAQDDLIKLAPGDEEFRRAVLEIQRRNAEEYALFEGRHYGEHRPQDGHVGPALLDLLDQPRCCPLPDVPPPPGVSFHFDDQDLQAAVESQQRAAESESRGTGAWPYGCWDGYQMHRLVVAVDDREMDSHWREHWPWLTEQCRLNYSWTGLRVDFVPAGERADVRLQFVPRSSGWIGLAEFPSGRCTDEVFCKLLTTYHGSRGRLLNLLQHEIGHNNRLQHIRGSNSIMNPVINDANPDWRQGDPHWSTLSRYYGGQGSPAILEDSPQPPPQPPPPAPPPGDYNGTFVFNGKILKIKVYE